MNDLRVTPFIPTDRLMMPLIEAAIREQATVDHGNDEATIQQWIRNAESNLQLSDYAVIATDDFIQLGVAACTLDGTITVNYVGPEAAGMGVGKAMIDHLEAWLRAQDISTAALDSSAAARHFYLKLGYVEHGVPWRGAGHSWNFPLHKAL